MREELRIAGVHIEHELMRELVKEAFEERGLFQGVMLAMLKAVAPTIEDDTVNDAEKAEHDAKRKEQKQRNFNKLPYHLQKRFNHC